MESPGLEDCSMASTPDHESREKGRRKQQHGGLPLMMFLNLDEGPKLLPRCPHASNLYHKCAGYCLDKISQASKEVGGVESVESNAVMEVRYGMQSKGKNSSNPYKLAPYCFRETHELDQNKRDSEIRKKVVKVERWNVHPECKYASNPYHVCVDKCFDLIREKYQN